MKKRKYLILGIFLILGFLIFNKTLSELKPVPKVTFKSQNLNYDKKEPGSFKVDKSAKWIGEGRAKVTIEVNSIIKESSQVKDVIFALDVSGSMFGDKLEHVKKDVKELGRALLSNKNNKVALIEFTTDARIKSKLKNNIDEFEKIVDNSSTGGDTSYKAGFEKIRTLLKDYKKEDNRDLIIIFLTDGYPDRDSPNEIEIYKELKLKYQYLQINAIQYEIGTEIIPELKAISDKQYYANRITLNDVLFEAGANPIIYDNFVITDYISKHFKGIASKIKASQGDAKLEGDQVTWNLGTYRSGTKATLEIELEHVGTREEFYKTNKGIDIKTSFEKQKDDQLSSKTPVLKDSYKVIYEANTPQGCTVKGLEKTTSHRPFEKIALIKGKATCEGYLFQGYELITDAKYINQDYIKMPEKDVIFRAVWTKSKINKSMQGKVGRISIHNRIMSESLGNDKDLGIDYSEAASITNGEGVYLLNETKNDTYPVYFFRGTHNLNNNIIYGGFCWKIVRTTETGGVRIVYNGTPVNGKCNITTDLPTQIGTSSFNPSYQVKKYVGYMYGDDANPNENVYDSEIKKYIDNWYKINIKDKSYEKLLDNRAIYCGDRTISNISDNEFDREIDLDEPIYYAGTARIVSAKPSLKCPKNDSYSVKSGNKKLIYPVALLSVDDISLAGGVVPIHGNPNINNYLYTQCYYWLLSPYAFNQLGRAIFMFHIEGSGYLDAGLLTYPYGVRPALTLKGELPVISGNGSQTNPYII